MKHNEQEIEIIAKSMYKAVKKALGSKVSDESKNQDRAKVGKEVVDDLMDPNFIAESKAKVPPKKTSQMNKSENGVTKLKNFIKNKRK